MPLYEFRCLTCEQKTDHVIPLEGKNPVCPFCRGKMEKLISAPKVTRVKTETGAIWDERQIHDRYGRDWRETDGSRRGEGGAGSKIYFHD